MLGLAHFVSADASYPPINIFFCHVRMFSWLNLYYYDDKAVKNMCVLLKAHNTVPLLRLAHIM